MIKHGGFRLNAGKAAATLLLVATMGIVAAIGMRMATARVGAHAQSRTPNATAFIQTKEVVLKYSLFQMRDAIDRYHTDKNQYPSSLQSLTSEGYITQIPTDPFTNRIDTWQSIPSKPAPDDPNIAAPGIHDVRSGSEAAAIDGTRYSDW
jgi:general secretion pathway protein G